MHTYKGKWTEADPARWNAWRYPTPREISRGRREYDMVFVGSADTCDDALNLLPRDKQGQKIGQVQRGLAGDVVNP